MSGEARCACGQPAPSSTICQACEADLRDALRAIPALAADLDIAIARLAVFTDRAHVRTHTAVLPFDERAAAAYADLQWKLFGWATVLLHGPVSHANGLTPLPRHDDLAGVATWLLSRMSALRQHEQAGTIVAEVAAAYTHARQVIDRPAQRVYAGPCDPPCTGELMSWPGRTLAHCDVCGASYSIAERQEWMRGRLEDHLVTAHEASLYLRGLGIHVTDGTIRVWASRRRLEARPGVVPKYRLGDIAALAIARDARVSLLASVASVAP